MNRKETQSRGRFGFYPRSLNKQRLILVIKAAFGDCWEPGSQIQGHWGRADGKEMAVSFDPLPAKVKLLAREVIWRCLSWS